MEAADVRRDPRRAAWTHLADEAAAYSCSRPSPRVTAPIIPISVCVCPGPPHPACSQSWSRKSANTSHCCCPANVRPKALRTSIRAAQSIWPNMGLQSAATRASLITAQGQEPGVADVSIRISTHPSTHLMVNASCMQAAGLDQ